ncbi:MAG TPA: cupin [Candidatus Thioglobus sp.]|nr:cupin [Candidatus Thioglobus sp.]
MSWHDISLDKETGFGAFILSMLPGAKSASHKRLGFEEIYILEGGLIDADGTVLQKGEFITFEPGSIDSTYTSKGCLLLVIARESSPTH